RDMKKLHTETTRDDPLFWRDNVELSFLNDPVLFELALHQSHRECRPIDQNIQIKKNEHQGTDMILMTMRKKYRSDFALVFEKIGNVRDDDVDAQKLFVEEHHTSIDNDDVAIRTKHHHMHSEFAEPPKKNDFKCLVSLHVGTDYT